MLTTRTSTDLLEGLRRPSDESVWSVFVGRYRPVLVGYARRRGLGPDDAEDAAQAALFEFSEAYRDGRYDRAKGRLRAWLFGIARNQVENLRRRRAGAPAAADGVALDGLPSGGDPDVAFEEEWRAAVLRQCLDEVRAEVDPKTWEAFTGFAIDDRPAAEVGAELGLSQNAVFLAKRRILRRARELMPMMEEIW